MSDTVENTDKSLTPTEQRMATEDLRKLVFQYSLPTVAGMLVNALYTVVDRFWIGQIPGDEGTMALTGVGLMIPIANVILGVAQLVGIGAAANISIRLGQKNRQGAEEILNTAFMLVIIFAALVTTLGLTFIRPLLMMTGASDVTYPYAYEYGRIIIGGCVFNMTSFAMNHCIRGTGNPKRFASTQFLGAGLNLVLDPLLIFGFNMGVTGAAVATILSQAIAAMWVFSYYFSKKASLRLRLHLMKVNIKTSLQIFSIGLSPFLMQVSNSFVNAILNNSLKHYGQLELGNGDLAVGAMTLINSITIFFFMPSIGINQGAQPIIGFNYGRKDYKRTKTAYRWAATYTTAICSFGWLMVVFFAPGLVYIFNKNPDLIALTSRGMRINLMLTFSIGFYSSSANFFTAIGKAKIAVLLNSLRQLILLIPMFLILPLFIGLDGIWYAYPISDFVSFWVALTAITLEMRRITKLEKGRENTAALNT